VQKELTVYLIGNTV